MRQFHRVKKDRVFAGVCSGLGRYFDIDPLIFRIIFLVLAFMGGSGFLIYILFWLLSPSR